VRASEANWRTGASLRRIARCCGAALPSKLRDLGARSKPILIPTSRASPPAIPTAVSGLVLAAVAVAEDRPLMSELLKRAAAGEEGATLRPRQRSKHAGTL
jgi:hypothetical protein